MNIEKLAHLMKEARITAGMNLFESTAPKMEAPPVFEMPEIPKTPNAEPLKLTPMKGLKKPLFTHETKTNSPYRMN